MAGDDLPSDFARIPPGSDKDAVLASVPGTDAAHDAIVDAQIPQTAKVDRNTASCTVTYDGTPQFDAIAGTSLLLARNSSATVIKSGNKYYCLDNAIWFQADLPNGPWKVSDTRPEDVDKIPPGSAAYNVKYVYIYETSPQFVYVGYTPGYLGAYVYGPVVVYGTGYYYTPWYVHVYYPRPVTYGFSVHYNPFTGWSIGFHYSAGFFHFHAYYGHRYGIWGPPMYRPPYYPRYRGGIYGGRPPVIIGGDVNINIDRSNNIYAGRKGVSNADIKRTGNGAGARPSPTNSQVKPSPGGPNNVLADKSGNVFRKEAGNGWQQLGSPRPAPVNNEQQRELDRQQQQRDRSQVKNQQFNQAARPKRLAPEVNRKQSPLP
ncbi:MAG: hypothetical protein MUF29_03325 [Chitinophagaceae bacterium]|nr:hypothetical protein [Chitinophagaceae bacterium]